LHDLACSLESVKKEVPLTGLGASMLDLKQVAGKHGLQTEVIRTTPSELVLMLPVLARMSVPGKTDEGHYVVVTKPMSITRFRLLTAAAEPL